MKKYSESEVKEKVEIALGMLSKNDVFLLEYDVNERSISHKLAEYLQQLFPDYHVDCEYNWQVDNFNEKSHNKELLFTKEEEKLFYPRTKEEQIKDKNAHSVFPDIIIHKRGDNLGNLLIIEIKKSSNSERLAIDHDRVKLEKYKEKFGYTYTLFLIIPVGTNFTVNNSKDIKINLNE